MKSTQLLSVVLSLIMFTGVTAGSAAFADSDDYYDELEDVIEDFCDLTEAEQSDAISDYPELAEFDQRLAEICAIEDSDERYDALYDVVDEVITEERDDFDEEFDEAEDDYYEADDDVIDSFEDCVEAGYPIMESYPEQCMTDDGTVFVNDEDDDETDEKDYDKYDDYDKRGYDDYIEDRIERFCDMTDEDKRQLFEDHPRLEQFSDRLTELCEMPGVEREDVIEEFIDNHERDFMSHIDFEMRDKLERYCDMSSDEKRAYIAEHDKTTDHKQMMDRFCTMGEGGKTTFIKEHRDEYKAHMMDRYHHMNYDKKHHMDYDRLCAMAESDRAAEVTDVAKLDKINNWCNMTPEERKEYKKEHHGMMKDKMHDRMMDKMHDKMMDCGCHVDDAGVMHCPMMDTDSAVHCSMMHDVMTGCGCHTADDGALSCPMDPATGMHCSMDQMHDRMMQHCETADCPMMDHMPFDRMSDMAKDRMSDVAKGKLHDKMRMLDDHHRLKTMIMSKYDVSDERIDEIKMKYREKHGDLSDERKMEIKMKFKDHMSKMKFHMTDERKAEIHDRLSEMRAFKAELRDKSSDLTVEQKQELREEFIEKAKDLQLAWITPRTQMAAGVDATEVECREGFSLVMKASNGVAMCLKADTALKMIDRGIVVPAN